MPRRKVVLDSDDEDNTDNSPVRHFGSPVIVASSPNTKDAQLSGSPPPRSIPSAGPSTGSTELLNREIHDAHTKLMEPSTSRSSRSSNVWSDSPSASQGSTTGFGRDKAQKPKTTYGTRKKQDNALLGGTSDDDEEPVHTRKRVRSSVGLSHLSGDQPEEQGGPHAADGGSLDNPERADRGTQGSAGTPADKRERDEQKNGIMTATNTSMAPPVSKSSASCTQTIQSSGGSTIPSTERASSPPAAHDRTSSETPQALGLNIPAVETSASATPRLRKRAISQIDSPKIILGDEVPPSSSAPAESPTKRQRISSRGIEIKSPMARDESDGGHDELSLSTEIPGEGKSKRTKLQNNPPAKFSHADELGSDDFTADLPQEHYQPRPSRSRSALTSDEIFVPQDFSKRPEALAKSKSKSEIKAKAKTKRRRATEPEDSTQRPADAVPDNNSDISTGFKGEAGGQDVQIEVNIPLPIDILDNAEEAVYTTNLPGRETSPYLPPPKKSRGRPKKGAPTVDYPSTEISEQDRQDLASPTKPVEPTKTPAKRGRKRKTVTEAQEDDIAQPKMPGSKQLNADGEGILTESDPNIQQGLMPQEVATGKKSVDYTSLAVEQAPLDRPDAPSEKMSPIKKKGDELATPIKNGVVQQEAKSVYRIGLSKRQRIPSLLKVVRK
ncbi:MAG: hypothetical protein Q9208_000228 [Pyrenodesmia sp. 3 TL-2023]